jgi:RNA-directed DNA polymerase
MTTRLTRLTQKVRELRGERLTSLMGMLFDPEGLRSSFERQEERKAYKDCGVRSTLFTIVILKKVGPALKRSA